MDVLRAFPGQATSLAQFIAATAIPYGPFMIGPSKGKPHWPIHTHMSATTKCKEIGIALDGLLAPWKHCHRQPFEGFFCVLRSGISYWVATAASTGSSWMVHRFRTWMLSCMAATPLASLPDGSAGASGETRLSLCPFFRTTARTLTPTSRSPTFLSGESFHMWAPPRPEGARTCLQFTLYSF
jgi:hypothetical protein